MIITIKLQPQMDCQYICNRIQEAIKIYQKHDTDITDALIIIDIKKPCVDVDLIPKLEFKNSQT